MARAFLSSSAKVSRSASCSPSARKAYASCAGRSAARALRASTKEVNRSASSHASLKMTPSRAGRAAANQIDCAGLCAPITSYDVLRIAFGSETPAIDGKLGIAECRTSFLGYPVVCMRPQFHYIESRLMICRFTGVNACKRSKCHEMGRARVHAS